MRLKGNLLFWVGSNKGEITQFKMIQLVAGSHCIPREYPQYKPMYTVIKEYPQYKPMYTVIKEYPQYKPMYTVIKENLFL